MIYDLVFCLLRPVYVPKNCENAKGKYAYSIIAPAIFVKNTLEYKTCSSNRVLAKSHYQEAQMSFARNDLL